MIKNEWTLVNSSFTGPTLKLKHRVNEINEPKV